MLTSNGKNPAERIAPGDPDFLHRRVKLEDAMPGVGCRVPVRIHQGAQHLERSGKIGDVTEIEQLVALGSHEKQRRNLDLVLDLRIDLRSNHMRQHLVLLPEPGIFLRQGDTRPISGGIIPIALQRDRRIQPPAALVPAELQVTRTEKIPAKGISGPHRRTLFRPPLAGLSLVVSTTGWSGSGNLRTELEIMKHLDLPGKIAAG